MLSGDATNLAQRGNIDDRPARQPLAQRRIEIRPPGQNQPARRSQQRNCLAQCFRLEIQGIGPPKRRATHRFQSLYTKPVRLYSRPSGGKQTPHGLSAKIKHRLQIPLHHRRVSEASSPAEWERIRDAIAHRCTSFVLSKPVLVIPQCVRTGDFAIHESMWRIPLGDLRGPPDRHPAPPEPVADQGASNQHLRSVHHAEVEPGGRDHLQVFRP